MSKPAKQSLLNEIRSERQATSGRYPQILRVLDSLDEKEREDLLEAINDYSISASTISRVLARRGIELSVSSISKYRRGEFAHVAKG